jgi:hypothetical protein
MVLKSETPVYKIYRNLHNGKLSIKNSTTGLVVGYCDSIKMSDVRFKVSEAGIARIRRDKRKSVVATVNGHITSITGFVSRLGRKVEVDRLARQYVPTNRIYFNPYKYTSFVTGDGSEINHSDFTVIESNGTMLSK